MKTSITSAEEVSLGQKENLITLVVDATRKAMGMGIDELIGNGVLNRTNVERVRARGNEVATAVIAAAKEKLAQLAENIVGCVRLISGAETITLDPTDGKDTIAKAKDTFPGYLDGDFQAWGTNVKGSATEKTNVTVHEMIKDGTFAQIFGGMSDNLDSLCLSQAQIIQFVQKHRKWLRTDGYGTFFLFKVGDEFFVADVRFCGVGRLGAGVRRLSRAFVWSAEFRYRVVVPQLALANQP